MRTAVGSGCPLLVTHSLKSRASSNLRLLISPALKRAGPWIFWWEKWKAKDYFLRRLKIFDWSDMKWPIGVAEEASVFSAIICIFKKMKYWRIGGWANILTPASNAAFLPAILINNGNFWSFFKDLIRNRLAKASKFLIPKNGKWSPNSGIAPKNKNLETPFSEALRFESESMGSVISRRILPTGLSRSQ